MPNGNSTAARKARAAARNAEHLAAFVARKEAKEKAAAEQAVKRGPGRPPLDGARLELIQVRVSEEELDSVQRAADKSGMLVPNWVRAVLAMAAK